VPTFCREGTHVSSSLSFLQYVVEEHKSSFHSLHSVSFYIVRFNFVKICQRLNFIFIKSLYMCNYACDIPAHFYFGRTRLYMTSLGI